MDLRANRSWLWLVGILVLIGLAAGVVVVADPTEASAAGDTITPAAELPDGFADEDLFSLTNPTDVEFTPDGRMLITTDAGLLRVANNDTLKAAPALDLTNRICANGERGMLGVVAHPKFNNNRFIYVFWTFNKHNQCPEGTNNTPVNRVTRYELNGKSKVVDGSARVIVDNIPSPATNHNAGDLHFGANGLLYVSTGDGGCAIGSPDDCAGLNTNSRRLDIPNGKILRVNPDGSVPGSNPFVDDPDARRCVGPKGVAGGDGPCKETFGWGLRNPFRFAIKPDTNQVWANDVGQNAWEEINLVRSGDDYGWNVREGFCLQGSLTECDNDPQYVDPEFAYDRSTDCRSITGGAFVPDGLWGAEYDGKYIFADFTCNSSFVLEPQVEGYDAVGLFPAAAPVALTFGPAPASAVGGQGLYYLEYSSGEVHRVIMPTP